MRKRLRRLLILLLGLAVGVVAIQVRRLRQDGDPAGPTGVRNVQTGTDAPIPPPARTPVPAAAPSSAGPADVPAFLQTAETARKEALASVRRLLKDGRGPAALQRIRQAVAESTRSPRHRLLAAFFVRLIPFISREDPGSATAALTLAREVLTTSEADSWCRFQALASLGDVPSSRLAVSAVQGLPSLLFRFLISEETDFRKEEFDHSLAGLARDDPSTRNALMATLASDSNDDVRALAARALRLYPDDRAIAALTRTTLSDEYFDARIEGLKTLALLRVTGFPDVVRSVGEKDGDTDVQAAAFRLLPDAVDYGPEVGRLLMDSAREGKLEAVRPAVAEATFRYFAAGHPELRPTLVSMLVHGAGNADLVRIYTERAGASGLTEFLPVFETLESSQAASPSKDALQQGIRVLRNAPHYEAVSRQTRAATEAVRKLYDELNREGADPSRNADLEREIDRLLKEMVDLRAGLRR